MNDDNEPDHSVIVPEFKEYTVFGGGGEGLLLILGFLAFLFALHFR